jgi:hypothetical protein
MNGLGMSVKGYQSPCQPSWKITNVNVQTCDNGYMVSFYDGNGERRHVFTDKKEMVKFLTKLI